MIGDHGLSVSDVESMRLGRFMQYVDMFADLRKVREKDAR